MHIIHWFRRDLRLTDNPALHWAALHADQLSLVYIYAPDEEDWAPGAASRWWLHHSLERLQARLAEQGQRLILLRGPSETCLLELGRTLGADAVSWNRLYEPALIRRDTRLKQSLREAGITAHSENAQLLFEPWTLQTGNDKPYRVFSPFWRKALRQLQARDILPEPELPHAQAGLASLRLAEFQLDPQMPWSQRLSRHWEPGEAGALTNLERFSSETIANYPQSRERPDQQGTSRLSPHLHWGEIGPCQVLAECRERGLDHRYITELGWREFAHHLLYHFPQCLSHPLNARYDRFPWRTGTECEADLARWQQGATGIDLVDAGMQELWQTGWMHNRIRMLTASLLTKNLGIHWQLGARWFWDTLVDADLANNTLGWQWVAGCGADAAPYFRIFNPATQALKFDPDGAYRARWLKLPRPAAMLDLKESRERALARYAQIRQKPSADGAGQE